MSSWPFHPPRYAVFGRRFPYGRFPAKRRIAVGKAAEPLDDVMMQTSVAKLLGVAESGEQEQRLDLVLQCLAVLERHVEEAALLDAEPVVIAAVDRRPGDCQRHMIGRELVGMAPEHVARE